MYLCPQQHASETPDFCTVCGLSLENPVAPAPAPPPVPEPVPALEPCPVCSTPRAAAESTFCEDCGYNYSLGLPPAAEASALTVAPSVTAPERWEIEARVLPEADPEAPREAVARIFPLDLPDLLIGRRSERRGLAPEIALEPDDGISHRHARLRRCAAGGFELLDLGSANGTTRNGVPVPPQVPVLLADGDRLRLGRWTELHFRKS